MGFESRAISARVTKQIVTIFSKTCDKTLYKRLATLLIITVVIKALYYLRTIAKWLN